jgi:hypothetical protein
MEKHSLKFWLLTFLFVILCLSVFIVLKVKREKKEREIFFKSYIENINNDTISQPDIKLNANSFVNKAFVSVGIPDKLKQQIITELENNFDLERQLLEIKGENGRASLIGLYKENRLLYISFWLSTVDDIPELVTFECSQSSETYQVIDVYYYSLGNWLSKNIYNFTPIRFYSKQHP